MKAESLRNGKLHKKAFTDFGNLPKNEKNRDIVFNRSSFFYFKQIERGTTDSKRLF